MWRKTLWLIEAFGQNWLSFKWCKGHAVNLTPARPGKRPHADRLARLGADISENRRPTDRLRETYGKARAFGEWLLLYAANRPEKRDLDEVDPGKRPVARVRRGMTQ